MTLLVRGDDLQTDMSRYLVHRIGREPRIRVLLHTEVRELLGDDVLTAVTVEDKATSDLYRLDARALFICAEPHTRWLAGRVALDRHGFVLTGADAVRAAKALSDVDGSPAVLETSRPGGLRGGGRPHRLDQADRRGRRGGLDGRPAGA